MAKPERPKNFIHDDKSMCGTCNAYSAGQPLVHQPWCKHASEAEPDFEDGAVWALTVLKQHVNARTDALDAATRLPGIDNDVGHVLNGTAHVLRGFLIHYETDMMKQLNARRVELRQKK
jgi:hypothetical protein